MNKKAEKQVLKASLEYRVCFGEVDMMGVVWHGHYLKYFEMAREEFAKKYGIDVNAIAEAGLHAPIVKAEIKYKAPAHYGETLVIEATYTPEKIPKFTLKFRVFEKTSGKLLATGSTTQIFTNTNGEVFYFPPPLLKKFWEKWVK